MQTTELRTGSTLKGQSFRTSQYLKWYEKIETDQSSKKLYNQLQFANHSYILKYNIKWILKRHYKTANTCNIW